MIKKLISAALCICLLAQLPALEKNLAKAATESSTENTETITEQPGGEMPREGMQRGMRGGPDGMMPGGRPGDENGQMPDRGGEEAGMVHGETPHMRQEGGESAETGRFGGENLQRPENAPDNSVASSGEQTQEGFAPGSFRPGKHQREMADYNGEIPENTKSEGTNSSGGFWGIIRTYSTTFIALILLICAFVFVVLYKRKRF